MQYTLMHKNIPVVDMLIEDRNAHIAKLWNIQDIRHLPPGINVFKTGIDRAGLNDWLKARSIPASRDGLIDALKNLGIQSTAVLISKCYGLSLSDQYWICPKDSELRWENVNFFKNDFPKDVGEILFGHEPADKKLLNLSSPDNTADGWLRKRWIVADDKRFLMKGSSGFMQQEPFNEVVASAIMRRLDISHVNYTLTFNNDKPYSLCENFVTPDTELIPAWRVMQTFKHSNNRSDREHFFHCCDTLGVSGVKQALDKMLTIDYIIANEDRHFNNFGLVRNAETLEWLGFAPVYDSGTSLWYNTPDVGSHVESKPFSKTHAKQIKLVDDLSWFNSRSLDGLDDEVVEILSSSVRIDENRRNRIASVLMERCKYIERLANEKLIPIIGKHFISNAPAFGTKEMNDLGCEYDKETGQWYHTDPEKAQETAESLQEREQRKQDGIQKNKNNDL